MSAARLTYCQQVMRLLKVRPRTTAGLHGTCLNPATTIRRLRLAGNVIKTERLPSGMAKYVLVSAAE